MRTFANNVSKHISKNNKLTHRLTKENVEEMFIRKIESDLQRDACNEIIEKIMESLLVKSKLGNWNKYITYDYWHVSISAKHKTDKHGFVYM